MNKAPKGGLVSKVNGERYEGGEFMPEHGLYCGLGKNRVAAAKLAETNAKLTDAEIVWNEKANLFQLKKLVTFADGTKFMQVQFSAANVKTLKKLVA